jgi:hypothetical protein
MPDDLTALSAEELLARFAIFCGDRAQVALRTGQWGWPTEADAVRAELLRRLRVAEAIRLPLCNPPPDPPADPE